MPLIRSTCETIGFGCKLAEVGNVIYDDNILMLIRDHNSQLPGKRVFIPFLSPTFLHRTAYLKTPHSLGLIQMVAHSTFSFKHLICYISTFKNYLNYIGSTVGWPDLSSGEINTTLPRVTRDLPASQWLTERELEIATKQRNSFMFRFVAPAE